nr:serine-arginine protein 55-like [Halyomorpha halys]
MAGTRIYIGGIPFDCKMRDLEDFVNAYGRTRNIQLKDGFGFIEFEDHRDADDAVYELNGKELLGERVVVEHARPMVRRDGFGGGRGFRGRGRGRGGGGRSWDNF